MNWNLIHKYLSGECNSAEQQQVVSWMEQDPRNKQLMASVQEIWEVTPQHSVEVDAKAAWQQFKARHLSVAGEAGQQSSSPAPMSLHKTSSRRQRKKRYLQLGVKIVSAAAVVLFALLFYRQIPEPQPAPVSERVDQRIETESGQRTTVSLADGSQIILNAASTLIVPAGFPEDSREVYLEGEAYFDVESDKEKPFMVYSEHTVTRVLGTKFGVRAYSDEDRSQAVVEEGEVMVGFRDRSEDKQEVLRRYDLAVFTHSGDTEVKKAEDLEKYLGWRNGRLYFKDTSFKEVERQLERWFAIEVEVEDPAMYEQVLTATFEDEPLTEVLNVIALSLHSSFDRDGRTITFK